MIIAEIPKANYCSFFCFLLTMDECIINVWGYTEILPNNDLSFNALDIVHLSKMTKLLTSKNNIDTDDSTINSHSETLKRHLAIFNLQLDRVQSDGDCAFRTIMRQVKKLVHNEAGQLSEHLRRL